MSADQDDVLRALLALDSYNRHEFDDQRKMSGETSDLDAPKLGTPITAATFKSASCGLLRNGA